MNRPLYVFKENGQWQWGCRPRNWASPQPEPGQHSALTRAVKHYDVAHAGPRRRGAL